MTTSGRKADNHAEGRHDTVHALTADGGIVAIRPVTPEDATAIAELYAHASAANLRLRLFAQPSPSPELPTGTARS